MNCFFCGLPLPETKAGRGRPLMYHPKCRKIEQVFSWLEDLLSDFTGTSDVKKAVRSRLWSLANLMNTKR